MGFRSWLRFGLCALAIFAFGGIGARSHSAKSALPPPAFRPDPGWVVLAHGPSEPSLSVQTAVAVTAPDAAALQPFAPFDGFTRLGPTGILVWATTMGGVQTSPYPPFPRARWPLRLATFRLDRGWEGQPATNIQQRLRWVAVGGWNLDVRVYFATQHPDEALLRQAQAELDRLVFPGSEQTQRSR